MIDLNKIVNDTLVEMEKENYVEKVVKDTLEKTIKSIVEDVFRSYSDFGKNLQTHIEENLNINFRNLGMEGYNGLVLAAVQEQLDKAITIQGIDKIKESMNEMLKDTKDEYMLTEIITALKGESCKEEYEFDYDERIGLIIVDAGNGYKHIYLDEEEKDRKYECDYQIDIDGEGKPYSIKLKGSEINTKKIMGGLYGLDKLLFKIYSSGAKIVLDQGECDEDYEYETYYTHED
ncbi:hypothetical protein IO99_00480 [Clostridium sulfidigenes]|uniref:Uncharacterized protein n=1 Tax=Clostridium sulfidigenes TaxID=318464 RepID=A0A084JIA7_9CLOT|nr:hypothetical protein [Clostridium sulfidigenes]KEZ88691.1 hypothetical protein IO99_00480 [Clostridium sulfidigenes]HAR84472.1 hypothetical protein [Clostridium sp.]